MEQPGLHGRHRKVVGEIIREGTVRLKWFVRDWMGKGRRPASWLSARALCAPVRMPPIRSATAEKPGLHDLV